MFTTTITTMLCLSSLSTLPLSQSAAVGGYGGSSGGGGYGGSSGGGSYGGGGYSSGGGGGGGLSFGTGPTMKALPNTGPINAAVQSTHTVEIQTVPIAHNPVEPQLIEVDANSLPLTIHFKSASSNINVVQSHQPGQAGEMQQTQSEDEPQHLVHEVTKPIIQEVREVITPYRRVVQEIRPVQEEIQTIVARGEPRQQFQHQQQQQFNGFNANNGFNAGQVSQSAYSGYSGSGAVSGYSGSGSGSLGGSVSILGGDSGVRSTAATTSGSGSLSSFSDSAKKGTKSSGSGAISQERTKDYAKSSRA